MAKTQGDDKRKKRYGFESLDFGNMFNEIFQGPIVDAIKKEFFITRPAVNIVESDKYYRLEMAIPGLVKEDIQIKLEGNKLDISAQAEGNLSDREKYNRKEFDFSNFQRHITLPGDANKEKIKAVFKNGLLIIQLNKKEKTDSRNIDID